MNFIWPLDDYIITRDFYFKSSLYIGGQHAALDLIRKTGATRTAPIKAIANGTVVGVGWDMYSGFFVAIDHANGFRSFYRHLFGQTPTVVGQQVSQGQIIGNVGNTGASQGDHLHFDLWNRNKIRTDNAIFFKNGWYAVDPIFYLGQEDDEMNLQQLEAAIKLLRENATKTDNELKAAVRKLREDATRRDAELAQAIEGLKQVIYGTHHPDDRISIVDRKLTELAGRVKEAGLKRGDTVTLK